MTRGTARRTRKLAAGLSSLAVLLAAAGAAAWDALPVQDDPLVRMPGTQPGNGVSIESPGRCLNCHSGYDAAVEPGSHWAGSMMSQSARDPLFWAAVTVALQDSIWALGRPNAGDLCLRCHSPGGWSGHRSDPPNGSALRAEDFDGVQCDACHRMVDPFFESTSQGVREGAGIPGYWDETNATTPGSASAALTTRDRDEAEAAALLFFNGTALYDDATWQPWPPNWIENGGGQFVIAGATDKRASFADANGRHGQLYSRYHKSRFFCSSCHDVSNPVFSNLPFDGTPPGDGATELPSEQRPAYSYGHVERTFSEFRLSDYGTGAGAPGIGPYDPSVFATSHPANVIATCQDCHLPDGVGAGADKSNAVLRPDDSLEHPRSGVPIHDLAGGNLLVSFILASTSPSSPVYDPLNENLLSQGPSLLTLDLSAGVPQDAAALLNGVNRCFSNLQRAAAIEDLSYEPTTGALALRVQNHTAHKLISGYPEGRRMWLNVRAYAGTTLIWELNPYSDTQDTLKGLPDSPNSPPLGAQEVHDDGLVYEVRAGSSLTGESHTFHMALATEREKDNRIPPMGFRIGEAAARHCEPVMDGSPAPNLFTPEEYAGGYDDVQIAGPTGADSVVVRLYYQTTSREFVEFLRDEIDGTGSSLSSPTPSGEPAAYVAQTDPFFSALSAWGQTIWQLWDNNRGVPGAAPVLMAEATVGAPVDPCMAAGSDGLPCDDVNACTIGDACSAGVCVSGSPVVCTALDQCHDPGSCDTANGLCSNPEKPDGTSCSDGTCQSGACVPNGTGGAGGTGGSGGSGGTSGTSGSGGTGGSGGTSGSGGSSGSGGTSGTAGSDTAGSAGTPTAGSGGAATAGTAGTPTGGSAGNAGGAGRAGDAGEPGFVFAGAPGTGSPAGAGGNGGGTGTTTGGGVATAGEAGRPASTAGAGQLAGGGAGRTSNPGSAGTSSSTPVAGAGGQVSAPPGGWSGFGATAGTTPAASGAAGATSSGGSSGTSGGGSSVSGASGTQATGSGGSSAAAGTSNEIDTNGSSDDSGCGCRTPGRPPQHSRSVLLLLLLGLALRMRRRRPSA